MKKSIMRLILILTIVMILSLTLTQASAEQPKYKTVVDAAYSEFVFTDTPRDFFADDITGYPYEIYLPNETNPADYRIHTNYARDTDACASCHATHTALGPALLQWSNTYATCMACHDGTVTTTYNVQDGVIGNTGVITFGGMFGSGNDPFLSVHAVNAALKLNAAPGGSKLRTEKNGIVSWDVNFGCESCHSPHGMGGNARILHPDANGAATRAAKAEGYQLQLHSVSGSVYNYTSPEKHLFLNGYPYKIVVKLDSVEIDPGEYTISNETGKTIISFLAPLEPSTIVTVYGTPSLKVTMQVENYLKRDERIIHKTGMNEFCGACHPDYDTTIIDTPGQMPSGQYSKAYRHAVGVDFNQKFVSDPKGIGTEEYMKLEDRIVNNKGQVITCLTCHVAHGVAQDYWMRAIGKNEDGVEGKYYRTDDHYDLSKAIEIAGSSALKRKPNMGTCETCHEKGKANEGYLALSGQMGYKQEVAISNPNFKLGTNVGVDRCLDCHDRYKAWKNTNYASHGKFTCERCHGPGEEHAKNPYSATENIINPLFKDARFINTETCNGEMTKTDGTKTRCHDGVDANKGNVNDNYQNSMHYMADVRCNTCHWPHDNGYYEGSGDTTHLKQPKDAQCAMCHGRTWDWASDFKNYGHQFKQVEPDPLRSVKASVNTQRFPVQNTVKPDHPEDVRVAFTPHDPDSLDSPMVTCGGYQNPGFTRCHVTNAGVGSNVYAYQGIVESVHYSNASRTDPASISGSSHAQPNGMNLKACETEHSVANFNWMGVIEGTKPGNIKTQNPGGCSRCHVGVGYSPRLVTQSGRKEGLGNYTQLLQSANRAELAAIDCFLCHADIYDPIHSNRTTFSALERTPVLEGSDNYNSIKYYFGTGFLNPEINKKMLYPFDPREAVFSSVYRIPSNNACSRCHNYAGGGLGVKRGMLYQKSTDKLPGTNSAIGKVVDVHAEKNVLCVNCHVTKNHKVAAGPLPDLWAMDIWSNDDINSQAGYYKDGTQNKAYNTNYWSAECNTCHGDRPHKDKVINEHYDQSDHLNLPNRSSPIGDSNPDGRVDCRTCHIPYQYGRMMKDWSAPKYDPNTGLYQATVQDEVYRDKFRPTYKWFAFRGNADKTGPANETRASTFTGPAGGIIKTLQARIAPFRTYRTKVLINPTTQQPYNLHLGTYHSTGNIKKAIYEGMDVSQRPATYEQVNYGEKDLTMNYFIGHRVQPKSITLTCADCHGRRGAVINWTDLGYTPDEQRTLRFIRN